MRQIGLLGFLLASSCLVSAGEIVATKDAAASQDKKSAKGSAKKAKESVPAQEAVAPAKAVSEDPDEGVLSPRGGAPADEQEYENRKREKAKQQAQESAAYPRVIYMQGPGAVLPGATAPAGPSNLERAGELRDRARSYVVPGAQQQTTPAKTAPVSQK